MTLERFADRQGYDFALLREVAKINEAAVDAVTAKVEEVNESSYTRQTTGEIVTKIQLSLVVPSMRERVLCELPLEAAPKTDILDRWEMEESWVVVSAEGMRALGYVEGQNVTVEFRWAEGQLDQLTAMATDLVSRHVAVIIAAGGDRPARDLLRARRSAAFRPDGRSRYRSP